MPASRPRKPAAPTSSSRVRRLRLHGWHHSAILAAAALALASGFAQFGVTTALADVAAAFGEPVAEAGPDASVAAQVGLSGTVIGVGLAIIRLASLGALPLSGLADRAGRRRVLLACAALGLAFTALAAASPSYWVFVAVFAAGRPLLSTTNAVAGVIAAEETRTADRSKAVALVTAAYGIGAGLTGLLRGAFGAALTFRGLFALALVPLLCVPLIGRVLEEPDRFVRVAGAQRAPVLGRVPAPLRPRLAGVAGLAFAIAFVTGPANTYLFVYAEGVLGMSRATTGALILAAGPVGLLGLLVGRWCADRLGRRPTAAAGQVVVAAAGALTYSGGPAAAGVGYLLAILAASAYAPAFGALSAELFPTRVRSTAAGWAAAAGVLGAVAGLLAFGVLTDVLGGFAPAAVMVTVPVAVAALAFVALPETRGLELEESAPDDAVA